METQSYLLALDSTNESKVAAYLAWHLAKKTGARVIAQHVIDVRDIWRFLRQKSAGFIGTAAYVEAFEHVTKALRSIANALMNSYKNEIEKQNIEPIVFVDEGDVVSQICKRAQGSDLLIIGHRALSKYDNSFTRIPSVCEELLKICPCPMLIVTSEQTEIKKISVHICANNQTSIQKMCRFVKSLNLEPHITFDSTIKEAQLNSLTKQLLDENIKAECIHTHNGKMSTIDEPMTLVIGQAVK